VNERHIGWGKVERAGTTVPVYLKLQSCVVNPVIQLCRWTGLVNVVRD